MAGKKLSRKKFGKAFKQFERDFGRRIKGPKEPFVIGGYRAMDSPFKKKVRVKRMKKKRRKRR